MSTLSFGQQSTAAASAAAAAAATAVASAATAGASEAPPPQDAKPAISFACLIGMGIMDSAYQRLTVSEVYDWMKKAFPYFSSQSAGTGWKNSVRHNLSLNKHFVKQVRTDCPEAGGKGSYWCIRPESMPIMEATIRKQHSPNGYLHKAGPPAASPDPFAAAKFKGKSTSRRPAPPSHSTSPRRPHTFNLREVPQSPQTSDREAASMLFSMTGQPVEGQAMSLAPRGHAAHTAAAAASAGQAAQREFPSLKNGRTVGARLPGSFAPLSGMRVQSGIKASYTLNAHKLGGTPHTNTQPFQPTPSGMYPGGSHRHQLGQSAPAVPIGQFFVGSPGADGGAGAAQFISYSQQQADQPQDPPPRRNSFGSAGFSAPAPTSQQKLFTFSAPMSVQGVGDSRHTPEYSNPPRSRIQDGADATAAPTLSPTLIRRRLAPLASPHEDGGGGMDCTDDATNGAVQALLGLSEGASRHNSARQFSAHHLLSAN